MLRRRALLTRSFMEETPAEKAMKEKQKAREVEEKKKEAKRKADKAAKQKVAAAARGAKSQSSIGSSGASPAQPAPPPPPSGGLPPGGAPMPPMKKIEIPKLPPEELPRSEKPIKKMSPIQRAKAVQKGAKMRREHLKKIVNDFYGILDRQRHQKTTGNSTLGSMGSGYN